MGSVLIVDDEQSFLSSLADGLRSFDESLTIYTARNGLAAVSILESKTVDIVVTDLNMPTMDGFELLVYIHNNYSTIPVIIITSHGNADIEHYFEETGGFQYMEKPLDFLELAVRITEGLALKAKGIENGVKLSHIMQFFEVVNKSCSLTVFSGQKLGHLYFKRGKLLDADYGDHSGAEAVIAMASWKDANIILNDSCPQCDLVIKLPIRKLLMWTKIKNIYNSKRVTDERKHVDNKEELAETIPEEADLVNGMISQLDKVYTSTTEERMHELEAIRGFCGAGIYSSEGKPLYTITSSGKEFDFNGFGNQVCILLANVHRMMKQIGMGKENLLHIETEGDKQILIKSLNKKAGSPQMRENKLDIHLLLILSSGANIRLARLKLATIIKLFVSDL